ncbi:MAG: C45 family peptidase [Pseudomonadota bacterium]
MATSRTKELPLVDVSGSPAQRGFMYGQRAAQRIVLGIENYKAIFACSGVHWSSARQIAAGFEAELREREPDLLTELEAIAEGAKVHLDEVLALNCRTEIMYRQSAEVDLPTDGCTGIIALPSATQGRRLLHAQNWDWQDECSETAIVLRIRYDNGLVLLTQTEAGILARCGLNNRGVALTGNFLKSDRDNSPGGIPIPFIRRRILEQSSLSDAIEVVYNAPKSFSTNLMISHADGDGINLETVPGDIFPLQPDKGLLVHANHFESSAAQAKVVDHGVAIAPSTLYRGRRVSEALEPHRGRLSIDHIKTALGDRLGAPHGVCADPVEELDGSVYSTVASIVMDVSAGTMQVAVRPYAEHTYAHYDLETPRSY